MHRRQKEFSTLKGDLHYCQKQTAKCPIIPVTTPKFNFPASDLAKERLEQ